MRRVLLERGDRVQLRMPYSGVCMHLRVAGQYRTVELTADPIPMAQIFDRDGSPFSAPVTLGEAGVYDGPRGPYVTLDAGDVVYAQGMYEHQDCPVSTSAWPVDSPDGGQKVEFRCATHQDARWSRPLFEPRNT